MKHGAAAKWDDQQLTDALWLIRHPGWTYEALRATPEGVLRRMALLEAKVQTDG